MVRGTRLPSGYLPDDDDPNDPSGLAGLDKQISDTAAWVALGAFAWLAPILIMWLLFAIGSLWTFLTTGDFFALLMSAIFWGGLYYLFVRLQQEGHI